MWGQGFGDALVGVFFMAVFGIGALAVLVLVATVGLFVPIPIWAALLIALAGGTVLTVALRLYVK